MAILENVVAGRRILLRTRTLIGRSPAADLQLERAAVSGEHACIVWVEGAWWVRDLGSRNGTWVGGDQLAPGQERRLERGARIHFASQDDPWVLEEDAPPSLAACAVVGGEVRVAIGSVLALPSEQDPIATIYAHGAGPDGVGFWIAELPDGVQHVEDRDIVVVDGRAWRLVLPGPTVGTVDARVAQQEAPPCLRFVVSLDEEHVELWFEQGAERVSLGARAHNELLLVLARRRLEDEGSPESEQGWIYRDELMAALRIDLPQLNLLVFRARKVLDRAPGALGAALIERRSSTGQLRIGVGRIEIERPWTR
ncbi:MAG: FHA domain-containing protein [Myxococcota bacterium]